MYLDELWFRKREGVAIATAYATRPTMVSYVEKYGGSIISREQIQHMLPDKNICAVYRNENPSSCKAKYTVYVDGKVFLSCKTKKAATNVGEACSQFYRDVVVVIEKDEEIFNDDDEPLDVSVFK